MCALKYCLTFDLCVSQSPEAVLLRRTSTCEAHHRVGAQNQRLVRPPPAGCVNLTEICCLHVLFDIYLILVCVLCGRSLFGNIQEEVVKDADSVRNQQQQHVQQYSCTLDECFQLYTKEEQVCNKTNSTK